VAVRVRRAVRALLVTPARELLLMQVREPESRRVFWITPGGGLEASERPRDGLRRELVEETGQADLALGPEVWTREHAHRWNGRDQVQRERFYLVRTPRFTPDPAGMPDAGEREAFLLYRWWTQ
jgi:8-oxo-dGTP pyrophosphatase MutT (NUDIX family)